MGRQSRDFCFHLTVPLRSRTFFQLEQASRRTGGKENFEDGRSAGETSGPRGEDGLRLPTRIGDTNRVGQLVLHGTAHTQSRRQLPPGGMR
jgi:hypothetical protein